MEITSTAFFSGLGSIFIAWVLMKVVDWVWLKPKKLEKWLRQQGFSGNSYRLLHGDMKEMSAMRKQAREKPINLSDSAAHGHDIVPRILPFNHHVITTYDHFGSLLAHYESSLVERFWESNRLICEHPGKYLRRSARLTCEQPDRVLVM